MTPNDVSAVNLGSAIRDGLQLKTVEVVAVLHNACSQIDGGSAATLPRSIDDLWVTDAGAVVLPRIARVEPTRATVAWLLEALLPATSADAVPAALRSLPARLRESGHGARDSDVKDLLTILRWHLPADSSMVLRDLVTRAQLGAAQPRPAAAIELFADEDDARLPSAITVATPLAMSEAVPLARPAAVAMSAAASVAMPKAAPTAMPEAVPAAMPAAVPHRTSRRSRRGLVVAASVALAIGAAGYVGYQRSAVGSGVTTTAAEDAAPVVPLPGRIVTRAAAEPPPPIVVARGESNARPLELAVNGGAFSPSFASGGTALVFHAGSNTTGRLFQASLDGGTPAVTPLLEDRGRTYHARLSPDGIWVAFDSDRDGERGVYVASRNGLHVARVSGEGFAAVPSWSPDMKWLAFVRAEPGRPKVWNLWLRDVETGELMRQSTFRSGQVWGASWFPGSRSISYSHEGQLLIRDTHSGTVKTFKSPIAGRLVRTPAVSPDGSKIVFQVHRDGAWMLDVKSGTMSRLLDDPTAEEFAWAPDGRQIAYHSRRDGQWRIWLLTI